MIIDLETVKARLCVLYELSCDDGLLVTIQLSVYYYKNIAHVTVLKTPYWEGTCGLFSRQDFTRKTSSRKWTH